MEVIDGARFLVQAQRDQRLPLLAPLIANHPQSWAFDPSFGDDLETAATIGRYPAPCRLHYFWRRVACVDSTATTASFQAATNCSFMIVITVGSSINENIKARLPASLIDAPK